MSNINTIYLLLDSADFDKPLDITVNVSELSKVVGISRQAVYNILDGSSIPKVTTAIKICRYLTALSNRAVTVYHLWGNF